MTSGIYTASGVPVDFENPWSTEIRLSDIEYAAANICRYNGSRRVILLDNFALATLLARLYCPGNLHIIGLVGLHDWHETVVGDVVSGLKKLLPDYRAIEGRWEVYFRSLFGYSKDNPDLAPPDREAVRKADVRALVLECWATNHPAYLDVAERFGGAPTDSEREAYARLQDLTQTQKWALNVEAVREGSTRNDAWDWQERWGAGCS